MAISIVFIKPFLKLVFNKMVQR